MEFISMTAMTAAIPTMTVDLQIGSLLLALVAGVCATAAVGAFGVYRDHREATSRRRTLRHLKMVQRAAFGAAQ